MAEHVDKAPRTAGQVKRHPDKNLQPQGQELSERHMIAAVQSEAKKFQISEHAACPSIEEIFGRGRRFVR